MLLWAITFITLIVLYFAFNKNYDYWKKRNVPFIKPTWLFGNVLPILLGRYQSSQYFCKLHQSTNEPYLGLFVFDQPFILIRDVEIIKHILLKDFDSFINRTLSTSKHDKIGSKLLIMLKDKEWKEARKSISPIFTPSKLKNMFPLINEVADELIRLINKNAESTIDSRNICIRYGVEVTSSCMFGLKPHALENEKSEFLRMTLKFFEVTLKRGIQIIACFFVPKLINFFNMTFIDASSMNFMKEIFVRVLREKKISSLKRNDFIDILRETTSDNNSILDEENLLCLAISFLAAGYETTGETLSFLLYELGCNQHIQEQLRNEVRHELEKHKEFSHKVITEMKNLDMVLSESLRKYPLLGFMDRICVKTYKVPNSDLVIEKGTGVYISSMGFHYDEQYFPNPEVFDPERFSPENKSSIPEYAYMPFGKGFRSCAGAKFAEIALKVVIAKLVLNFKIELSKDSPHSLTFDRKAVLLTPKSGKIYIRFIPIQ